MHSLQQSPITAAPIKSDESFLGCSSIFSESDSNSTSFDGSNIGALPAITTIPNANIRDTNAGRESAISAAMKPGWSNMSIFNSNLQRENAIFINQRQAGSEDLRFPDVFRYGLRFRPKDGEQDVYRTILISNIPSTVTIAALLDQVRGGSILDVKLLNTAKITGSKSAIVTFLLEDSAVAFRDYAKSHPLQINGHLVQVTIVPTPTWPICHKLRKAIYHHQHTRCLEIYNFPPQIPKAILLSDLSVCPQMWSNRIVHMEKRKDDILELHFSSINYADQAYGMLSTFRAYSKCTPYFVPDPCAQPFDSSQNDNPRNTTMFRHKCANGHDAETGVVDQSGRLSKLDFNSDPEVCRGRGFEDIE